MVGQSKGNAGAKAQKTKADTSNNRTFKRLRIPKTKYIKSNLGIGHGTSPEDSPSALSHVVVDALVLSIEVACQKNKTMGKHCARANIVPLS